MKGGLIAVVIAVVVLGLGIWWFAAGDDTSNGSDNVNQNGSGSSITTNQPSYRTIGRDEEGVTTVAYTEAGFSPFIVEIEAGETVRFVNQSDRALRVTSQNHPTATDQNYPEFDSVKSLSNGEEYVFTFTREGVWGYKDLNNEQYLGAVVVVPQE